MTRTSKNLAVAVLAGLFAFGNASIATADDQTKEAIAAAKAAQKKAASVGGEWRDTRKLIKKAESLLAEGKVDKAKEAAEKALQQGILGYQQSQSQSADKLHI